MRQAILWRLVPCALILFASSALAASSIELLIIQAPEETARRVIAACSDAAMESSALDAGITRTLALPGVKSIFTGRKPIEKDALFQDIKPGPEPPPTDEPDLVAPQLGLICECNLYGRTYKDDKDDLKLAIRFSLLLPAPEKYAHLSRHVSTNCHPANHRWTLICGWSEGEAMTLVLLKYRAEADQDGNPPMPAANSLLRMDLVSASEGEIEAFHGTSPEGRQKAARSLGKAPKRLQSAIITCLPGHPASINLLTEGLVRIPDGGSFQGQRHDAYERSFTGLRAKIEGLRPSDTEAPDRHYALEVDWTSHITTELARDCEFPRKATLQRASPLLLEPEVINRPSKEPLALLITRL